MELLPCLSRDIKWRAIVSKSRYQEVLWSISPPGAWTQFRLCLSILSNPEWSLDRSSHPLFQLQFLKEPHLPHNHFLKYLTTWDHHSSVFLITCVITSKPCPLLKCYLFHSFLCRYAVSYLYSSRGKNALTYFVDLILCGLIGRFSVGFDVAVPGKWFWYFFSLSRMWG